VFSAGERPFLSLSGEQTAVYITEGGRLDKPPSCPQDIYSLMKACWKEDPQDRPSFAQLSDKLKSKSSIYYYRPIPVIATPTIGTAQKPLNSSSGSRKFKPVTSPPNARGTKLRSGGKQTPGVNSQETYPYNGVPEYLHDEMEFRNDIPTSSSEASLNFLGGGANGIDREDLTRGDKFRKSLGRLMKMNKQVKETKGTPTSGKLQNGELYD